MANGSTVDLTIALGMAFSAASGHREPRSRRSPERKVAGSIRALRRRSVRGQRSRTPAPSLCTGLLAARPPSPSKMLLHLARVPWAQIGEHIGQRTSP